jgi:hypothetical protein
MGTVGFVAEREGTEYTEYIMSEAGSCRCTR